MRYEFGGLIFGGAYFYEFYGIVILSLQQQYSFYFILIFIFIKQTKVPGQIIYAFKKLSRLYPCFFKFYPKRLHANPWTLRGSKEINTSTVHRGFSQTCLKVTFDKMSFLGKLIYMAFLEATHKQTQEIGTITRYLAFKTRH